MFKNIFVIIILILLSSLTENHNVREGENTELITEYIFIEYTSQMELQQTNRALIRINNYPAQSKYCVFSVNYGSLSNAYISDVQYLQASLFNEDDYISYSLPPNLDSLSGDMINISFYDDYKKKIYSTKINVFFDKINKTCTLAEHKKG